MRQVESRRSDQRLSHLTRAAYSAATGHLELDPEGEHPGGRRRWAPSVRAAVAAAAVVLLLALSLALWVWATRPGDPVPLPGAPPSAAVPAAPQEGGGAVTGGTSGQGADPPTGPDVPAGADAAGVPGAAEGAGTVVVHVAGAVARPGVVKLAGGARVGDAVDAAGGATTDAELAAVNLARVLGDGEQVYLPRVGEAVAGAAAGGGGGGVAPGAGTSPPDAPPLGPVNLNTAGAAELDALPGVGPAIAGRILQWRELNGPFTAVDDLDEVAGIGPATLERLRPLVTV